MEVAGRMDVGIGIPLTKSQNITFEQRRLFFFIASSPANGFYLRRNQPVYGKSISDFK